MKTSLGPGGKRPLFRDRGIAVSQELNKDCNRTEDI